MNTCSSSVRMLGRWVGVFKATKGLQEEFGRERVIDSPLAEGILISSSIGAAMAGMRPVAEIQFADFIAPAMDSIAEQAAKLRYRSAGTQTCPLDHPGLLRRRSGRRTLSFADEHELVHSYAWTDGGRALVTV